MALDVSTRIQIQQGIRWSSRLGIIRRIEVTLTEIAIHGKLQEEIVEGAAAQINSYFTSPFHLGDGVKGRYFDSEG